MGPGQSAAGCGRPRGLVPVDEAAGAGPARPSVAGMTTTRVPRPPRPRAAAVAALSVLVLALAGCAPPSAQEAKARAAQGKQRVTAASPASAPPDGARAGAPVERPAGTDAGTPEHLHVFEDGSGAIVPPREEVAPPAPLPSPQAMDDASAMATLAYFYDARHYAFATGDVERVAEVSAQTCSFCEGIVSGAASLAEQGYDVRGGTATLYDAVAGQDPSVPDDPAAKVVEATLVVEPQFLFQGAAMVLADPAEVHAMRAALRFDGQRWRVAGVSSERVG